MKPLDITDLLPDPNNENYEKIKAEHPYNILIKYASALGKKYPHKIGGTVIESTDVSSETLFSYAFYITAAIGNGYSYRLLELKSVSAEIYPVKITIFELTPHTGIIKSPESLEARLQNVFRSGFTHTLILNLLSQIEFYGSNKIKDIAKPPDSWLE